VANISNSCLEKYAGLAHVIVLFGSLKQCTLKKIKLLFMLIFKSQIGRKDNEQSFLSDLQINQH